MQVLRKYKEQAGTELCQAQSKLIQIVKVIPSTSNPIGIDFDWLGLRLAKILTLSHRFTLKKGWTSPMIFVF